MITVYIIKSTENDCGSCLVAGNVDKNETISSLPFFNWDTFALTLFKEFKFRLNGRYAGNL